MKVFLLFFSFILKGRHKRSWGGGRGVDDGGWGRGKVKRERERTK